MLYLVEGLQDPVFVSYTQLYLNYITTQLYQSHIIANLGFGDL